MTVAELEALAEALACDDARLGQRIISEPCPTSMDMDVQCVRSCAIGCALWLSRGPMTSLEVNHRWNQLVNTIREKHGDLLPYALLHWWDTGEWQEVRAALLGEVSRALGMRLLGQRDMATAEEPVVVLIAS